MRLLFRRCAAKIALHDGTFVMLWTAYMGLTQLPFTQRLSVLHLAAMPGTVDFAIFISP
jgi:hypothetical protein